ncbi:iron complex transport system permease protein [Nocardiopsis mwathae]|uniref:Iron complex transport system permease protein n=1 Tax=Nocardiopsis mwathae TaxID=1472723 RepID=A0A7X0D7R1_9ACTN|nr:iron ABC transporter permease [Nocardiopsis mwathae]MBB6174738.1 iron complex transport system permease protein [Nocardiopsis mwathae]
MTSSAAERGAAATDEDGGGGRAHDRPAADGTGTHGDTASPTAARHRGVVLGLVVLVLLVGVVALGVGRYSVGVDQVVRILLGQVLPIERTWSDAEAAAVLNVRLPRVLLSMLVGAGLAVCGAVLQAVFGNPIVSPQILGVSSGASFGGALAIVLGLGSAALVLGAFMFGLVALVAVFAVSRVRGPAPPLTIVLSGIVVGAFFSALVSLLTYLADPYSDLPSIVFWLLGSLAAADATRVAVVGVPVLAGGALFLALRWRINVLSLGDEDAATLGLRPGRLRWLLLAAVAAVVAGAVAVSGVIGWVGLVVPHLARLWVGSDHRAVIPVSLLLGAAYLTVIDTVTRNLGVAEIPLGVLTALIGAPVFLALLHGSRRRMWADA